MVQAHAFNGALPGHARPCSCRALPYCSFEHTLCQAVTVSGQIQQISLPCKTCVASDVVVHTCGHEQAVLTCCKTNMKSPYTRPAEHQSQPRSPSYAHNELCVCEVCFPKSCVDSVLNKCKPRLCKHLQTKAMLTLARTVYNLVLNCTHVKAAQDSTKKKKTPQQKFHNSQKLTLMSDVQQQ